MHPKFFRALALWIFTTVFATGFQLPSQSTQCIVGIAPGMNSSEVELGYYEKIDGRWQRSGDFWKGRLGKSGLVWGNGLHPNQAGTATKREGDQRSPAGVFAIGGAWGSARSIRKQPRLSYRQVTSRDLWVEDPTSASYNRNVILDHEPSTAWERKQQMKQDDPIHALKLFIAHNAPPKVIPNGGSSIFFHIWRGGGAKATAGCTTMEQSKLQWVVSKIDPARRPLYILLTAKDYEKFRGPWNLP